MSDQPRKRRRKPSGGDGREWMVETHYRPRNDQGDETVTVSTSHGPFSCRDAAECYAMNLAGHSPSYRGCRLYPVETFTNRFHTMN